MQYQRIAVFSILILLALMLPGAVLAALLGSNPSLFGNSLAAVRSNFDLLDHAFAGSFVILTYVWFLWRVARRLFAHALIAFLLVEVIQLVGGWVLGDSIADVFVLPAFLAEDSYAVVGLARAYVLRAATGRPAPKNT